MKILIYNLIIVLLIVIFNTLFMGITETQIFSAYRRLLIEFNSDEIAFILLFNLSFFGSFSFLFYSILGLILNILLWFNKFTIRKSLLKKLIQALIFIGFLLILIYVSNIVHLQSEVFGIVVLGGLGIITYLYLIMKYIQPFYMVNLQ